MGIMVKIPYYGYYGLCRIYTISRSTIAQETRLVLGFCGLGSWDVGCEGSGLGVEGVGLGLRM